MQQVFLLPTSSTRQNGSRSLLFEAKTNIAMLTLPLLLPIMGMRGVRVGGVEETVDQLWSLFLRRLRKELVEEWYVARLEGSVGIFEKRVCVGGVLGEVREGEVEWGALFDGVRYRYWDLFD